MLTALQVAEQIDMICNDVQGNHAGEIRAVLREAEKILRAEEKKRPLTADDVRLMMRDMERGMGYAVYLEDRGYYMIEPVIIDRALYEGVQLTYGNGMRYAFELKDYNKTWRLWDSVPSGVEMKMAEWRTRK